MQLLAFCDKSYIVQVLLIIKIFFKIACILVPIIIIISTITNLFKAIQSGEDKDLKEVFPMFVKRVIAGLIIFFLPTLISAFINNVAGVKEVEFLSCFDSASKEKVASLQAKEKAEREAEAKLQKKEDEKKLRAAYEKEQKERNARKVSYEQWKKEKEEEERRRQQQQQVGSGTGNGGGSELSNVTPGTVNIIIGDSRTVQLCASMTGDWTKCQFSNGGKNNGTDVYIAQGSKGYSWFESTALPYVNSIISSNPNTRYNIYSLMGVNFLLSDIDKYIAKYSSLANNEWKNQNIILVSVGPVNEAIEAQHGYSTKNSNIETFNAKLKNGVKATNVSYCDIYTPLTGNFHTEDGLHYGGSTNNRIYDLLMQCK